MSMTTMEEEGGEEGREDSARRMTMRRSRAGMAGRVKRARRAGREAAALGVIV